NPPAGQKGTPASGPLVGNSNAIRQTPNGPLSKGPLGKTNLSKGPTGPTTANGPTGQAALSTGANPVTGTAKGPNGPSGIGKGPLERRRLVVAHRGEILAAWLRLPHRPLPGERGFTGVPPRDETRFVARELVLHVPPNVSRPALDAAMRRHALSTVSSQATEL